MQSGYCVKLTLPTSECEGLSIDEEHEALYSLAHAQHFEQLRPKWPRLRVAVYMFVTPEIAKDLERILLAALTGTLVKNGNVITSKEYEKWVIAILATRSGNTPRGGPP